MRSSGPGDVGRREPPGCQEKIPERNPGSGLGRLTVVSLGPGSPSFMAPQAGAALARAEVVVGYRTYLDLVEPELLEGKKVISSGMKQEIARCRAAIEEARGGRDTALVSSGDAGIYGMAGLVLELLEDEGLTGILDVEVVPGIPALSAAAALLGAPLMHDFAVVSLSDLMTPWEAIEARLEAAARADFVLVLYNPRSRRRDWQLDRAREIVMGFRSADTPVGIVRNAGRDGEWKEVTSLGKMDVVRVDMLTIVLIGNSGTRNVGGRMVTPRGYLAKYL